MFKETGLGLTTVSETVTLRIGFAAAEYQCFNGGGKHPSANNKETVGTSLSLTQQFPVRNGETTGRFVTAPVPPGAFSLERTGPVPGERDVCTHDRDRLGRRRASRPT